jgi:hypothetical protein
MNDHPDPFEGPDERDPDPDPAGIAPEDLEPPPTDLPTELRRTIKAQYDQQIADDLGTVPRPINWSTLTPDALETELRGLNDWVDWLRHTYGLPAQIIPPVWHRHPELLWELSALRQHWLFCYDRQAKGNQALAWHQDFAAARERLRDWVTIAGTRLDRDRPTRITYWPGGEPDGWAEPDTTEQPVTDRNGDFAAFLQEQVQERRAEQDAVIRDTASSQNTRS